METEVPDGKGRLKNEYTGGGHQGVMKNGKPIPFISTEIRKPMPREGPSEILPVRSHFEQSKRGDFFLSQFAETESNHNYRFTFFLSGILMVSSPRLNLNFPEPKSGSFLDFYKKNSIVVYLEMAKKTIRKRMPKK